MRNARSGRNPRRCDLFFHDAGLGSKEFHSKHSLEQSHLIDRMTHKKKNRKTTANVKTIFKRKIARCVQGNVVYKIYNGFQDCVFHIPTFSDVLWFDLFYSALSSLVLRHVNAAGSGFARTPKQVKATAPWDGRGLGWQLLAGRRAPCLEFHHTLGRKCTQDIPAKTKQSSVFWSSSDSNKPVSLVPKRRA